MSMYALLQAVRNRIREATATGGLAYNAKDCDIAPPNGQPPPSCGPYFIAIHEGSIQPELDYSTFDEVYSVNVTVTIRPRATPWDRFIQRELYGAATSLDTRCRQIAALIHQDTYDHRIINAANLLIDPPAVGYAVQGFVEPLRFAGLDAAKEVGPAWFHANLETMDVNDPPVGWAKTIRFTGARRVQETLWAEVLGVVS